MREKQNLLPADCQQGHEETYLQVVQSLFTYYGKDLDAERATQAYRHLKHIPLEAFVWIVERIEREKDNLPRNIAKAFIDLHSAWIGQHQHQLKKTYDPEEDLEFPLEKLHEASRILNEDKANTEAFFQYCDSVGMPRKDRNRVWDKAFNRFWLKWHTTDEGYRYAVLYKDGALIHSGLEAVSRMKHKVVMDENPFNKAF